MGAYASTRRAMVLGGLLTPLLGAARVEPVQRLSGAYQAATGHPRVFTSAGELQGLARRVSLPGSYSAQRFASLARRIAQDLATDTAWDAAYAGNVLDVYLYAFSYEPRDPQQETVLRSALGLPAGSIPPAGAAPVAGRLALYAALAKAGATLPSGAPPPEQAAALARRILLAWTDRGFRDTHGQFLSRAAQFANPDGSVNSVSMTAVGLQVSRGVVYAVQAQDMLTFLGALDSAQAKRASAFHAAMYELIRQALNYRFVEHAWDCDHYSNHVASQLTGLLATARLLDDKARFEAALHGGDLAYPVVLPWTRFFAQAIYGAGQAPHACYQNSGPDGLSSRPFFQTASVAPGEIDDRYRNANPLQGIGYPMFTLQWLYVCAEILRGAGYEPYAYRGPAGQSIELASRFYAAYAKNAGFGDMVTAGNAAGIPDAAQYVGKLVNGADAIMLAAAARFPGDVAFDELEASARPAAAQGVFSADAVSFGLWRN